MSLQLKSGHLAKNSGGHLTLCKCILCSGETPDTQTATIDGIAAFSPNRCSGDPGCTGPNGHTFTLYNDTANGKCWWGTHAADRFALGCSVSGDAVYVSVVVNIFDNGDGTVCVFGTIYETGQYFTNAVAQFRKFISGSTIDCEALGTIPFYRTQFTNDARCDYSSATMEVG